MKPKKQYLIYFVGLTLSIGFCFHSSHVQATENEQKLTEIHTQFAEIEEHITQLNDSLLQADATISTFNEQIKGLEMKIAERKVTEQQQKVQNDKLTEFLQQNVPSLIDKKVIFDENKLQKVELEKPLVFLEVKEIPIIEAQIKEVAEQKKLIVAELLQQQFNLKRQNLAKELLVEEIADSKPESGVIPEQLEAVKTAHQQQILLWDKRNEDLTKQLIKAVSSNDMITEDTQQTALQFGFKLPVTDPVSSKFGVRTGYDSNGFHKGIDFASAIGTKIHAAMAGEVVIAQEDGASFEGYGKVVLLRHTNGTWTLYAHQSELLVKVGEQVEIGQVIGKVGATGQSDGAHLHFEVRTTLMGGMGAVVDPAPLLGIEYE
ncbi:peptidoglycan DD-metalloendopeptidase family protein [Carnobacterium gallinarum]|uniref:peptidoglycan DD-metalloendopeptidase family protein n=1 Tax=Carnobacterium gallinarum TaxID=2749 RepID=UPI0005529008|nr:M23 family metallopeptidase [Carnobacterium gallinarum]